MSNPTLDERGLQLVEWYLSQPDNGTWLSDRRIGHRLGWFRGGRDHPKVAHNATLADELAQVDVATVRKVRRHVDRCDDLFAGYWFGTKRNGSGQKWSHLNSPEKGSPGDALDAAAAEMFARARQAEKQWGAELERHLGKWLALQEDYTKAGQIDKAFICHDAVRDLQTTGRVSLLTIEAAKKAGIPIPAGRDW